jgi:tetratricopeptide (TPR) repeat protein
MLYMRSLLGGSLVLFLCALSACSPIGGQGRASQTDRAERDNAVVLSPSILDQGRGTAAAWLAYGITKVALLEKSGVPPRKSVTDFDSEVQARELMIGVWNESREKDGGKDTYLDLLARIKAANFLAEYVLAAFARPGWTIPGKALASLRLADYFTWAETHVPRHQALTLVEVVSRKIPQHPRVLGDFLPRPESLSPDEVPCAESSERLTRAHQAWRTASASLKAAPMAAANREQFVSLLRFATEHATDYPNGVVWVSPKAYRIAFFAGFCAVDRADYPAAASMLRSAKALVPLSAEPRLEIVQLLANTRQLAAAMEELDAALQLRMGKCMQGVAWRKRGFVLFELGKLKDAYQAYQKSLEFDPGNKIAYSELTMLAAEILRREKLSGAQKRLYAPPPVLPGQLTTRCTD